MIRSNLATSVAFVLPVLVGAVGCASTTEQAQSVANVDGLLTHIERVHVDATLAKEKAHAALTQISTLVSPNFAGDATKAFAALKAAIKASEDQTQTLRRDLGPMGEAAGDVFTQWTRDLEDFGNSRLRQRSQSRLDETRGRYQSLLTSTQSLLISFDSFNSDLKDTALFLGSDLNASAVTAIHPDVRALHEQIREVDARVEVVANAARTYVESSALYGQVEATPVEGEGAAPTTTSNGATTTDKTSKVATPKRRSSTLKPRPAPTPEPATLESTGETPAPAEGTPPADGTTGNTPR